MTEPSPQPRRRRRKLVTGLAGVLVLLLLLVALAPSLVSMGVGLGALTSAAGGRVNGTLAVQRVRLGWFGPQTIDGLRVTSADGRTTGAVDVTLSAGLVDLLRGPSVIEVDLAGALHGELREDGTTSFEDLLVRAAGPTPPAPGTPPSAAPLPRTVLRLDGLDVSLSEPGHADPLSLRDLAGTIVYDAGGLDVDLTGATAGASGPGTLTVGGDVSGLLDGDGAWSPAAVRGAMRLQVSNLRVPLADRPTELSTLELAVRTDDPTGSIELDVNASVRIEGVDSGRVEGRLVAERVTRPDGSVRLTPDRLTGRVTGTSVPTALLQRALRGTPLVATRDLGPTVELDARFGAGESRDVSVEIVSPRVRASFEGRVNPERQSLHESRLRVEASVQPELLGALTTLQADGPLPITFVADEIVLPPGQGSTLQRLRDVTLTGRVRATDLPLLSRGGRRLPRPGSFELEVAAPDLAHVVLSGDAVVDGVPVRIEGRVNGLIDERGTLAGEALVVAGEIRTGDLGPATLAAWLPEHADLIRAALAETVVATVAVTRQEGTLSAAVEVQGIEVDAAAAVRHERGSLWIERGRADVVVAPELVAALPAGTAAVRLVEPARVVVQVEPVELPLDERGRPEPDAEIRGRIEVPRAALASVPGLAEPVEVEATVDRFAARLGPPVTLSLQGGASLLDAQRRPLARTRFDLDAAPAGEAVVQRLEVAATELAVAELDGVLGGPAGVPLEGWLGATGRLGLTMGQAVGGDRVEIDAEFPGLRGQLAAELDGDTLSVTGRDLAMKLPRAALQSRMQGVAVDADVPVSLQVRSLRVPRAVLRGEPVDTTAVAIDVSLEGGPLVLSDPDLGRQSIEGLRASLTGADLVEGLGLTVNGDVRFRDASEPGALSMRGRVLELLDGRRVLAPGGSRLELETSLRGVPTPLVDAVMDFEGLLTAAVGPRLDLVATARDFSRHGGRLDARIDAATGWVEGVVRGEADGLLVRAEEGVRAELELTPPLRERLLKRINPILADIRTTEQPIRATVGRTIVPLDGDLARLESDLDVSVGAVEFSSGSTMLRLLKISRPENAETFPGHVETIKARIRKGVVTYERFAVRLDKYTLAFSGRVDLNTREVDLRTEVPLEGLAGTFRELEGLADDLVVPLVTRGTIDDHKTEIEPEFLAEAAGTIGIRKGLDEIEKETGVPVGDIFEGLFGKKKKKKDDE